jgi:uncharacterized Tic20 family protein
MESTTNIDKRKLFSALCHGAIFFSPLFLSIGIPLTILLITDDLVVKDNAKESINFHLNIWVYAGITAFISFFWWTIIALPLIWILGGALLIANYVLPILAIISCLSETAHAYRYPFILRVF